MNTANDRDRLMVPVAPITTPASNTLLIQESAFSTTAPKSRLQSLKQHATLVAKAKKQKSPSIKFTAQNFVTQLHGYFDDSYEIAQPLGEGAYGDVFVCRHLETQVERAVKILQVNTAEDARKVQSEFDILRGIDHPNLLKIYHLFIEEQDEQEPDEDNFCEDECGSDCEASRDEQPTKSTKFYIVSDLYQGGELYDELDQNGHFAEGEAAMIMNQVLSCVNYCHQNGIAHRDIKPENILLQDDDMHLDDVKIIDFGLAAMFDDYHEARFHSRTGSSYYISPQVLEGDYGPKCDVWSCGVVAYILLCGEAPFDGDSDMDVIESILEGHVSFDQNPTWDDVSDDAMDFVAWLLTYEEEDRPTAEQALRHPWLEKNRRTSSLQWQYNHLKSHEALLYLHHLQHFAAPSKLQQAVCAFIASQLILKQEKDVIDELFRAMDTECDGRLDRAELKAGFETFLHTSLTDEQVDAIFQRVNFSCSGAIDYSEFVIASIPLDETRLRATFSEFDKSGSGVLTADNLKEALALHVKHNKDVDDNDPTMLHDVEDYVVNKVLKQVDTNQDGRISFEEFKAHMMMSSLSSTIVGDDGDDVNDCAAAPTTTSCGRRRSFGRGSLRRSFRLLLEKDSDDCNDDKDKVEGNKKLGVTSTTTTTTATSASLKTCQSSGLECILNNLQSTLKSHRRRLKSVRTIESVPHAVSVGYAKRTVRAVPCCNG